MQAIVLHLRPAVAAWLEGRAAAMGRTLDRQALWELELAFGRAVDELLWEPTPQALANPPKVQPGKTGGRAYALGPPVQSLGELLDAGEDFTAGGPGKCR